tara:strand:- start:550 stop:1035 length:486 start_codon:yes stop_codon:yes gene_type:complete
MNNYLILLAFVLPSLAFSQNIDYTGEWVDSSPPSTVSSSETIIGEKFENTLTLEKIKNKDDSYKFTFFGWRDSYDKYARQVIKFSGQMLADYFVIEVRGNKAYYNDDALVEDGELPLYREGEERCKVYFAFNKDSITVKTQDCNFIYGGFGVAFDGTYKKN